MKDGTAAVQVQVPVEVASFLLNEKRTEIAKIELKQRVNELMIPNKTLETPNYRLDRLKHDDPRLDNVKASYHMAEDYDEATTVTRRSHERVNKQEPVIKGVLPDAPAPMPVAKPPVQEPVAKAAPAPAPAAAAPAPAAAAETGFFSWIKGVLGLTPAAQPAPVAAPAPAAQPRKEEKREGRGGERGREGGRREGRGERGGRGRGGEGRREGEPRRERVAAEGAEGQQQRPEGQREGQQQRGEGRRERGERGERGARGEGREPREAREQREPREPRGRVNPVRVARLAKAVKCATTASRARAANGTRRASAAKPSVRPARRVSWPRPAARSRAKSRP
jgi:ribonuclease E